MYFISLKRQAWSVSVLLLLLAILWLPACKSQTAREIVVYTSVDQVFSEPIFKHFEEKTGLEILAVYDVEATKTTGLVNRLIAEKDRPQADVFWSGEFAQSILLKKESVLSAYISSSAEDIPFQYKDKDGYWTGFAGRARTLLINTELVAPQDYPLSVFDLLQDKYPASQIGIAYPIFGTTATEAAAYYAAMGPQEARSFYQKLYDRGTRVVDGNSVVRDLVADGQLMMGLTDTDDACGAIEKGKPVILTFLDQNDQGSLVIPNTVALISGGRHPKDAKTFIDYLLSQDTSKLLIESGWSQIPLRSMDIQVKYIKNISIKSLDVSLEDVYQQMEQSKKDLTEIFIR